MMSDAPVRFPSEKDEMAFLLILLAFCRLSPVPLSGGRQ